MPQPARARIGIQVSLDVCIPSLFSCPLKIKRSGRYCLEQCGKSAVTDGGHSLCAVQRRLGCSQRSHHLDARARVTSWGLAALDAIEEVLTFDGERLDHVYARN